MPPKPKRGYFCQIVPHARKKDAVGRMAIGLQQMAKRLGYQSLIFTERQQSARLGNFYLGPLRRGLTNLSSPWNNELTEPPPIALYHHSIGSSAADCFRFWPATKKILVYHNITPPELVAATDPNGAKACQWGIDQLRRLVEITDAEIGLSRFSCESLTSLGARNVIHLPYLLWNRELVPKARRSLSNEPVILVVGRVEPFKGVLESVMALQALRRRRPEVRMVIVGQTKANPAYVARIEAFVRENGLQEAVRLLGRLSDHALHRWYRRAQALLTLSSHEGFCVPIAEAMRARLPVVALASGAIPETLGRGGLLLTNRDPQIVASALERVLFEPRLADALRSAQADEVERFDQARFTTEFSALMEQWQ